MQVKFRMLSEFLKENNIKEDIVNSIEYKCGGVRLNGRGVFVREIKLGSDIQKQWVMHKVKENNVIYSTLFADKGAFAVAKKEDEELVFSEKFVSFDITTDDVLPEYLHVVFQTDYLSSQCNEFKTGMAAFSLSHSSKKKVLKLSIPVPNIDEQRRIVEEYAAYEALRIKLDDEAISIQNTAQALIKRFVKEKLSDINKMKLSMLGSYVNRPFSVNPGEMYKQITVKLHGNGVVLRKLEDGSNIKSKQNVVRVNDLIYSKIDVKSGAIGFVTEELDGGVVTADFPLVSLNEIDSIDREFLMIYFSSDLFCDTMEELSKGTTNRVRAKKGAFLENEVPWGDRKEREEIVNEYRRLCFAIDGITTQAEDLQNDIPVMTSRYLNKLLGIA